MRRLCLLAILLASAAAAADPDFRAVVKGIESHYGVTRARVPLLGLASFFVKVAQPAGIKQLDLAVFEDLDHSPLESEEFGSVMAKAVGDRWRPLVHVRSQRDGEQTYIYVRRTGKDWKLLVAVFEPREASVIELRVAPEALARLLQLPERMGKCLGTNHDGRGCPGE